MVAVVRLVLLTLLTLALVFGMAEDANVLKTCGDHCIVPCQTGVTLQQVNSLALYIGFYELTLPVFAL